nr:YdcH family protein [uncultured Hyphomonas sp.]
MSHTPHELTSEFPDLADKIHALKTSDTHFSKLADEYHDLNREIHRMETDVEPTSDEHLTELRKQRLALKDTLYDMLKA